MDINCGEVIDGTASIQDLGQRLFQMMLDAASGKKTKSEQHGYGQNEFVPWQCCRLRTCRTIPNRSISPTA